PDYVFDSWVGLAGPKNIPAGIVEVLNGEINASLARPEIKAKYDDLGLRIHAGSPADFARLIADDTEKWGKVIRAGNIAPRFFQTISVEISTSLCSGRSNRSFDNAAPPRVR